VELRPNPTSEQKTYFYRASAIALPLSRFRRRPLRVELGPYLTHILTRSQPADAGGRIKPGGERGSAEPQALFCRPHPRAEIRAHIS